MQRGKWCPRALRDRHLQGGVWQINIKIDLFLWTAMRIDWCRGIGGTPDILFQIQFMEKGLLYP